MEFVPSSTDIIDERDGCIRPGVVVEKTSKVEFDMV